MCYYQRKTVLCKKSTVNTWVAKETSHQNVQIREACRLSIMHTTKYNNIEVKLLGKKHIKHKT